MLQTRTLTLAKMDDPAAHPLVALRLPDGVTPTTVTVSRDTAGRYFVSILIEEEIASSAAYYWAGRH